MACEKGVSDELVNVSDICRYSLLKDTDWKNLTGVSLCKLNLILYHYIHLKIILKARDRVKDFLVK